MANDQTVLAASQLLNVNAGEAVSAVVKVPFRIPPFAGLLGKTTMPSAGEVATQRRRAAGAPFSTPAHVYLLTSNFDTGTRRSRR